MFIRKDFLNTLKKRTLNLKKFAKLDLKKTFFPMKVKFLLQHSWQKFIVGENQPYALV